MNENLSTKKSTTVHQKIGSTSSGTTSSGIKRLRSGQKSDIVGSATKPASGVKRTNTGKQFDPVLQNANSKKIKARSPNTFK